ncbi:flagellar hook-associated protein FlgL [Accumulibacter sp.]|uniref:flagellar hook-associated protein FlgL n=1 Tax=Accumulibacter sp. TaxID=2053492 RepID=UPI0025E7EFC2|nr:flagellar hook-associated protein FlgL [Accumulibacter sp.]MCM8610720.1 flagellar hook-associated protein FlgL [Accumulibacter sp.]MCM8634606.1 flagellar hook-associated protein FlgL [Accumulibacter sp.]MCM8638108.1 flagellar hook-associated protein FlgL [Accumulibacter sp.]
MRISTSQIYAAGASGIERRQNELLRLQEQLSSGRRVLTPADDPVAAARALEVTQAKQVGAQYARNQGIASDRLRLVDSQLTSLTDVLQSVRSRIIQAGNTVLADSDRQALASELEARFEEVLGIANSRSAEGEYLFSGHLGATMPFARGAAVPPATSGFVRYFGDDGERLLQVAASQQMATGVAGSELFMQIREGNGSFVAAASGNGPGLPNQGNGVIGLGSVLDQGQWAAALNGGFGWQGTTDRALQIRFSTVAGASSYQLFDVSQPAPPAAALPPTAVGPVLPFTPGQAIPLVSTQPPAPSAGIDFGAQVVITGSPAAGDTFSIRPNVGKSVFQTLQETIDLLRLPLGSSTARTEFSGKLQGHLAGIDQALAKAGEVQSSVGTRLQTLEGLSDSAAVLDIQYQETLSDLVDLDYVRAISDFTREQATLEAAQKSFVAISGLSLFKYL